MKQRSNKKEEETNKNENESRVSSDMIIMMPKMKMKMWEKEINFKRYYKYYMSTIYLKIAIFILFACQIATTMNHKNIYMLWNIIIAICTTFKVCWSSLIWEINF